MCTETSSADLIFRTGPTAGLELVFAIQSLTANLPHANIYTAGCRPPLIGIEHIDVPHTGNKFSHAFAVLQTILDHEDLTPDVVIADDDMFLMRPIERLPEYHCGPLVDIKANALRRTAWQDTLDLVPDGLCRELHIPSLVNRADLKATLDAIDLPQRRRERLWWRTLAGGGCTLAVDAKVRDGLPDDDALWVSSSDASWGRGVGQWVRDRILVAV